MGDAFDWGAELDRRLAADGQREFYLPTRRLNATRYVISTTHHCAFDDGFFCVFDDLPFKIATIYGIKDSEATLIFTIRGDAVPTVRYHDSSLT